MGLCKGGPYKLTLVHNYTCKPAELAAGRRPRKNCGLAAVDFAEPPARKKIRLSRRFSAGLFYTDAHHG